MWIATDFIDGKTSITFYPIMHDRDRDITVLPLSRYIFKMKFITLTFFFFFEGNIIKVTGSLILG